jgi:hypothetical protein
VTGKSEANAGPNPPLAEQRYAFVDNCIVTGPDGLVYFKDDGQPWRRLIRGLHAAGGREDLDRAVAGGSFDACWIGLAEHEHGDHGLPRAKLARAVWVMTDGADRDLESMLARVPGATIAVGTLEGEPLQIGWLLDSPETDPDRYEALSHSLAARLGDGFRATTMTDLVLLPGTSWLTRGGWHQAVRAAFGSSEAHSVEDLQQSPSGPSAGLATAPPKTSKPIDSPSSVGASRAEGENVHTRAHDVEVLAHGGDILARLRKEIEAAGHAGPADVVELVFLAVVSRRLRRPLCVIVRAASSAGKSFAVEIALRFAPEEACVVRQTLSPKALSYTSEVLKHRILVIAEAAGVQEGHMAYALRELVSNGSLVHEVTNRDTMTTDVMRVEGPTGLILTTTRSVDPELATRMLSVGVSETPEQTRLVVDVMAREAAGETCEEPDYEVFHLLDARLAAGTSTVVVPFSRELASLVSTSAVRMRRDFRAVLTIVQAHALLHQATRARDNDGRIVATLDDYSAAHRLVAHALAEGTEHAVSSQTRDTVEAVRDVLEAGARTVTVHDLREALGVDESNVRRRVAKAVEAGYLHDARRSAGQPHKLTLAEELPNDRGVLPTPDRLRDAMHSCTRDDGPVSAHGDPQHVDGDIVHPCAHDEGPDDKPDTHGRDS